MVVVSRKKGSASSSSSSSSNTSDDSTTNESDSSSSFVVGENSALLQTILKELSISLDTSDGGSASSRSTKEIQIKSLLDAYSDTVTQTDMTATGTKGDTTVAEGTRTETDTRTYTDETVTKTGMEDTGTTRTELDSIAMETADSGIFGLGEGEARELLKLLETNSQDTNPLVIGPPRLHRKSKAMDDESAVKSVKSATKEDVVKEKSSPSKPPQPKNSYFHAFGLPPMFQCTNDEDKQLNTVDTMPQEPTEVNSLQNTTKDGSLQILPKNGSLNASKDATAQGSAVAADNKEANESVVENSKSSSTGDSTTGDSSSGETSTSDTDEKSNASKSTKSSTSASNSKTSKTSFESSTVANERDKALTGMALDPIARFPTLPFTQSMPAVATSESFGKSTVRSVHSYEVDSMTTEEKKTLENLLLNGFDPSMGTTPTTTAYDTDEASKTTYSTSYMTTYQPHDDTTISTRMTLSADSDTRAGKILIVGREAADLKATDPSSADKEEPDRDSEPEVAKEVPPYVSTELDDEKVNKAIAAAIAFAEAMPPEDEGHRIVEAPPVARLRRKLQGWTGKKKKKNSKEPVALVLPDMSAKQPNKPRRRRRKSSNLFRSIARYVRNQPPSLPVISEGPDHIEDEELADDNTSATPEDHNVQEAESDEGEAFSDERAASPANEHDEGPENSAVKHRSSNEEGVRIGKSNHAEDDFIAAASRIAAVVSLDANLPSTTKATQDVARAKSYDPSPRNQMNKDEPQKFVKQANGAEDNETDAVEVEDFNLVEESEALSFLMSKLSPKDLSFDDQKSTPGSLADSRSFLLRTLTPKDSSHDDHPVGSLAGQEADKEALKALLTCSGEQVSVDESFSFGDQEIGTELTLIMTDKSIGTAANEAGALPVNVGALTAANEHGSDDEDDEDDGDDEASLSQYEEKNILTFKRFFKLAYSRNQEGGGRARSPLLSEYGAEGDGKRPSSRRPTSPGSPVQTTNRKRISKHSLVDDLDREPTKSWNDLKSKSSVSASAEDFDVATTEKRSERKSPPFDKKSNHARLSTKAANKAMRRVFNMAMPRRQKENRDAGSSSRHAGATSGRDGSDGQTKAPLQHWGSMEQRINESLQKAEALADQFEVTDDLQDLHNMLLRAASSRGCLSGVSSDGGIAVEDSESQEWREMERRIDESLEKVQELAGRMGVQATGTEDR
ncbi:expressed unknown protein [Seminavis robusta]|uniref:Uncharacterized protein n=1 Tax=Seminavis robusta TaxID=568900 RepID=A0A9N8E0I8_9STRA|nr:expressed unknown protein [Seminavis robusta]|eukprot:Sro440_g143590.1 n/a (1191) ;mRNA; r:58361-61933